MLQLVPTEEGTEVFFITPNVCLSGGESERAKPERGSPGKPQTSVSFSLFFCLFQWFACSSKQRIGLHSLGGHTLADQQQLVQCYTVTGVQ